MANPDSEMCDDEEGADFQTIASYGGSWAGTPMVNDDTLLMGKVITPGPNGERREELDSIFRELVTFDGCPELLRGSALSTIMGCGAAIFHASNGSAETFKLSGQVGKIDAFLSHNWVVGRYQKFAALSFHFNFAIATNVLAVLGSLQFLGLFLGLFPVNAAPPDGVTGVRPPSATGWFFKFFTVPIFMLIMIFLRDVQRLLGIKGLVVFLDKTCIHQEDMDIQRRGIEKLGAFLANSERMVVLYTDVYLKKLWTVYEVASFLTLHQQAQMEIVPVLKAQVFYWVLGGVWVANNAVVVMSRFVKSSSLLKTQFVCYALLGPFFLLGLRRWARDKAKIRWRLSGFTVNECQCFAESDRPIVSRNIANLMRGTEEVPRTSREEAVLMQFDEVVRRRLPSSFLARVGSSRWCMFNYVECVWFSVFIVMPQVLDTLVSNNDGTWAASQLFSSLGSVRRLDALCNMIYLWLMVCTVLPISMVLGQAGAASNLHLTGFAAWAFLFAVMLFGIILTLVMTMAFMHELNKVFNDNFLRVGLYAAIALMCHLAARQVFIGVPPWLQNYCTCCGSCFKRRRARSGDSFSSSAGVRGWFSSSAGVRTMEMNARGSESGFYHARRHADA